MQHFKKLPYRLFQQKGQEYIFSFSFSDFIVVKTVQSRISYSAFSNLIQRKMIPHSVLVAYSHRTKALKSLVDVSSEEKRMQKNIFGGISFSYITFFLFIGENIHKRFASDHRHSITLGILSKRSWNLINKMQPDSSEQMDVKRYLCVRLC
jgi:hypothetical protein